jgi:hypothetical protein
MNANPTPPPSDVEPSAATPSNSERLRTHLSPDGLAVALLDAWKKDDPQAQARMLAALHDFNKPK